MKVFTLFLTLSLMATLAGCQTGSRRGGASVEPGPALTETVSLLNGQIEMTAEFGHRSRLLHEADQVVEDRDGDFGDRRRRYFPGSIQENYLRLSFRNTSAETVSLEMGSVVTSMGRFSPSPRSLEIPAGETGRLTPFFFTYPRHYGDYKAVVAFSGDRHSEQVEVVFQQ